MKWLFCTNYPKESSNCALNPVTVFEVDNKIELEYPPFPSGTFLVNFGGENWGLGCNYMNDDNGKLGELWCGDIGFFPSEAPEKN